MEVKRVLITGAAGLTGGVLRQALNNRYELRGLDLRPVGDIDSVVADITVLDSIRGAFNTIDTVIHLAADSDENAPWDSVLAKNIIGTYNVFEAARQAAVGRVIFASSIHTTAMYERDMPYSALVTGQYERLTEGGIPYITPEFAVRPDGYYGISKLVGEALGRYYSDEFGMSVICLRLGSVNRANRPLGVRERATWLSHRDLVQLVKHSIGVQGVKFEIFYGISNNKWRLWAIGRAREVLGYEPVDDGSAYADA